MRAIEDLVSEHRAVLVALRIMERIERALASGDAAARAHLEEVLDFLKGFVDRCHHGKEEDVLFPEMERRGVPREGGPIGVMLAEHQAGRGHIRAMAEGLERLKGGDAAAAAAIREASAAYRGLLEAHIAKENSVLFPLADRLVPDDVAAEMYERFEAIERDRVGVGKHEAYHAMLHRLEESYGVT